MSERSPPEPGRTDLLPFLLGYLRSGPSRFVLVSGSVGAGKSSLLRALYAALPTERVYLLYQQPNVRGLSAPGGRPPEAEAPTRLLLVGRLGEGSSAAREPSPFATGPAGTDDSALPTPPALSHALEAMSADGGTVFVDSWDRDSERFLRSLADETHQVTSLTLPPAEFGQIQGALLGMKVNLVLSVVPEMAEGLHSLADALIQLKEQERGGTRFRVVHVSKFRGASMEAREFLYSLDGGVFRPFPDLPRGFVPPTTPLDPDPEPDAPTIWPGSATFAAAFGRLRPGAFSAVTIAPDTPDTLLPPIVRPLAAQALSVGGRVVWMPSPSVRPSRVLTALQGEIPSDWLRERLRIVSASGDDPGLGELRSIVLPLRREMGARGDVRAANAPGVGPIFPDAHRFLGMAPPGAPAVYLLSLEGLKAAVAAAGLGLNATTLPAVLAAYGRIPRFHGFGYGRADDPLVPELLPLMDTIIHLQVACGRPVLSSLRPRSSSFVMDWPGNDGRYALIPTS